MPGGVAVFFPSYHMLQVFTKTLHTSDMYSTLNESKRLFIESREDPNVFEKYANYIRSGQNNGEAKKPFSSSMVIDRQDHEQSQTNGALILAVIGGRLSEGINFSDDLGRCVAIVGMPYANRNDPILQERMRFAESQQAGAGETLYTNLCMKAVNQTIGRAFRHRNDWAAIALLDSRYTNPQIRAQITPWINSQCQVFRKNEDMKQALRVFVNRNENVKK